MRKQQWIGAATMAVLVILGVVLFLRRSPDLRPADCGAVIDRHAELYGSEHAASLVERRDAIVNACTRYATPAYVACVREAADLDALATCSEIDLRARPSKTAPTPAACEDQAAWRLLMQQRAELPSLAPTTSGNSVDVCTQYWSAEYVDCLRGAPSLAFAEACEDVGRAR